MSTRILPEGAILDDEPQQEWNAPTAAPDEAEEADAEEAMDEAEEGAEEEEEDVIADPYYGDEQTLEEGAEEEPWRGASAAPADAEEAPVDGEAQAAAAAAAGGDDEQKSSGYVYTESTMVVEEDEEVIVADEEYVPQVGDLTAAFFSEMAASQSSHRSNKRRRDGGDEDSDEEYGVVQSRAFAIPAHLMRSFDPTSTAPPASAEEYLLRVRMEAQACPRIKVSDIDPRAYVHKQTAYMPPLGLVPRPANAACLPSAEWQNQFAAEFAQARQQLLCYAANHSSLRKQPSQAATPAKRDYAAWIQYCVGNVQQQITAAAATAAAGPPSSAAAAAAASPSAAPLPHCPSLPLVVSLDQLQTKGILLLLLQLGSDVIAKRQHTVKKAAADADSPPLPPFPFPSHAYTLWLYTLLLKVDKPIASHLAAGMRGAFRAFSWLRAHDNAPHSDTVKYCNMILTILDRSFGQSVGWNTQLQEQQEEATGKQQPAQQEAAVAPSS